MLSWRFEYLEWKGDLLSDYQKRLLKEGPSSLSSSWALAAMRRDYVLNYGKTDES